MRVGDDPDSAAERVSVRTTSSLGEGVNSGRPWHPDECPCEAHGLRGGYTRGAQGTYYAHTRARAQAHTACTVGISEALRCTLMVLRTAHRRQYVLASPTAHAQRTCITCERVCCVRRYMCEAVRIMEALRVAGQTYGARWGSGCR